MHISLPQKLYYSIGEVAEAFGVNASLIRFWEKEFDVLKPKKNAKGNRKFTPEDIKNLQFIYHLVKERGFTLEGAKTHLKEQKHQSLKTFEIIRKLEAIRAELNELKTLIKSEMENAFKLEVPLDVEVDTGLNWLEAH